MNERNWRRHRPLYAAPTPKEVREPKNRWRILPVLWRVAKRTAMGVGFVVIINALLVVFALSALTPEKKSAGLPHEMVLFLGLEDGFHERPRAGGLSEVFAGKQEPSLQDLIDGLDKAAGDKRVKGLVARMNGGDFDLARSHEMRSALKRFRAAGKFAYIYSPSYGEGGGGLGRYYLASAFDEIWMQPLGVVSITGVSAEIPFGRDLLDKVGVTPNFFQRKEYKSAYESLTNKSISPANREEMTQIVQDIRAEIMATIPKERSISPAKFEALVDKGLLTADEAKKSGLVTQVDYGDVLLDNIAEKLTGQRDADAVDYVTIPEYVAGTRSVVPSAFGHAKPKVALVYALGPIMPTADGGGFGGEYVAAADEIAPVLHDIAKDDSIKAVVLRIDSPGGSPSASESILRAVEKVQASGKPVVVSMGSVAASGGYWIAAYANRIFALPTTLTGSIGVVGGKFSIGGLSQKLGVNWETISWGQNAGLWSMNKPFNESESERMNAMMDQVYDSFVARVARGRKMKPETVDKVAGGRVWSGRQAIRVGLVDEIGGLNEALDYAATLAGKKSRGDLNVEIMPRPKTALEQFAEMFEGQVLTGGGPGVKIPEALVRRLEPVARMIEMQENPELYATYEFMRVE